MTAPIKASFILDRGTELGYEWVVSHNGLGYRCGYIKIPPGHPWYEENYELVNARVHGGLTAALVDENPERPADEAPHIWLGFDCAHYVDAPDPLLTKEPPIMLPYGAAIRTEEYVRQECLSLCQQADNALKEARLRRFLNFKASPLT